MKIRGHAILLNSDSCLPSLCLKGTSRLVSRESCLPSFEVSAPNPTESRTMLTTPRSAVTRECFHSEARAQATSGDLGDSRAANYMFMPYASPATYLERA